MLTIKHVGPDGRETIMDCGRFERQPRSDGFTQYLALPETWSDMDYLATWCGSQLLGCDFTTPGFDHTQFNIIYVMNRHGKTVETYKFLTANHDLAQQPEPLAA